jgi:hydroxymethylglutaryl-CoA lyase
VRRFLDAGFHNLSLADTAGHADPEGVEELYTALFALDPTAIATCHFHNTYGLAIANCIAAMRVGVQSFESSVAGLGGCPFTKIAGGNTCTEDFVHYLQRRGRRCDVDLAGLIGLAGDIALALGRELSGNVYRTGPIPQFKPIDTCQ